MAWLPNVGRGLAFAAVLALSWPGLGVARAGDEPPPDLAPSASELFGLAQAKPEAGDSASCAAAAQHSSQAQRLGMAELARALARLQAQHGGDPTVGRALDPFKYHYAGSRGPAAGVGQLQIETR